MTSTAVTDDPRPRARRRALVTGDASGIGKAIALSWAGASVTVLDFKRRGGKSHR